MERPPVLTLTEKAADRVKALVAGAEQNVLGLRVGVKSTGCSGHRYFVEYATEQKPYEEIVEDKGVKVLIDPAAVMFLIGTELDWEEGKLQSQFVFNNPNEAARCGCGESFQIAQDKKSE